MAWTQSHKRSTSTVALFALAVGQFLVGLDLSVMSVALPSIQAEFDVGMMQLQWAMMAYMVAGAALAVPFGALGDNLGRRRLYLFGTAAFVIGSAVSALAPDIGVLIFGRAVQGVGSGAMGTLALAMLVAMVARADIPKLIGLWTAVVSGAAALGPLVGGGLVTAFGWRWVFGINVILMAMVIPLVLKEVPSDSKADRKNKQVDMLGAALLTVAMILIAGGMSFLENYQYTDPIVWLPVAIGFLVVGILATQQRRSKNPLTDWAALRVAPIPATLVILVILGMVLSGAMLQLMMLTQNVLGFTPLIAGVVSFGTSLMVVVFSPISPKVMAKIGLGLTTTIGLLLTAGGLFGLATITVSTTPPEIMAWMALMGAGLGFGMPAVSAGAMSAVPRESLGAISGFIGMIASISAVLGIAVLGAISAIQVTHEWEATSSQVQNADSLTDQVISGAIPQITKSEGEQTAVLAGQAYLDGVTFALRIAGAGMVLAGAVSFPLLGSRGRVRKTDAAPTVVEPPEYS
ncbi:MFS transporter [Candidatus Nanopelagicales bacterium]|nr:MFS transporter [Candidatus Nanopelagicales bacterium]